MELVTLLITTDTMGLWIRDGDFFGDMGSISAVLSVVEKRDTARNVVNVVMMSPGHKKRH